MNRTAASLCNDERDIVNTIVQRTYTSNMAVSAMLDHAMPDRSRCHRARQHRSRNDRGGLNQTYVYPSPWTIHQVSVSITSGIYTDCDWCTAQERPLRPLHIRNRVLVNYGTQRSSSKCLPGSMCTIVSYFVIFVVGEWPWRICWSESTSPHRQSPCQVLWRVHRSVHMDRFTTAECFI